MFHVVLVEPEIPPNTGNIIRLCANTGAQLHLIEPLGFAIDHAKMRRAGLDYREFADMQVHQDWAAFLRATALQSGQVYFIETGTQNSVYEAQFKPGDALVFGCETRGLPATLLQQYPAQQHLCLPMRPGNRSLNLSNAVAISVYEAWRQQGFSAAL
ncbi:MAG: tRNA (cytidine(34)-2'-O)-methyltransferase [bacterium]|jgi:tRNA (cytidine/uridine-2'-O-)-methyltransferase